MSIFKSLIIFSLGLLLTACGSPLEGTYTDAMGVTSYTFKSDDKVYLSVMGNETELEYTVADNKVKISGAQGNMVFTINQDGTLQGPLGMQLTKKPAH